jgi:hypothetical protein
MWVTLAAAGTPLPFMSKDIIVDRGGGAACTREHQLRGLKTAVRGGGRKEEGLEAVAKMMGTGNEY